MANANSRKALISCFLFDVIKEHADREHQLSCSQIHQLVETDCHLNVSSKTIERNLSQLLDEDAFHIFRDEKTGNYFYDRLAFLID